MQRLMRPLADSRINKTEKDRDRAVEIVAALTDVDAHDCARVVIYPAAPSVVRT